MVCCCGWSGLYCVCGVCVYGVDYFYYVLYGFDVVDVFCWIGGGGVVYFGE